VPEPSLAFINYKPVMREVLAASFRDRVVHHFIFAHINPLFENSFIEDSYSCRKGKGTLYGSKRIHGFMKACSKNHTQPCYILKLDLKGYFYAIDRKKLFHMIKATLTQHRAVLKVDYALILYLIETTIFNNALKNVQKIGSKHAWAKLPRSKSLFFAKKGKGLPIGNLTSQLFSNIYMDSFDKYVKETLGITYYGRYVDDFIVIHEDPDYIKSLIPLFRVWLKENLGMTLHPQKICLQPYQRGVQFLGAYLKPNVIYIDKRTKTNFYKLIEEINNDLMHHVDDMQYYKEVRARVNSYLGTLKHFSSFNLRKKIMATLRDEFWVCFGIDEAYKKIILNCKYGFRYEQLLSSSHI
jgi:retron-type reverse transcriptase